MYLTIIGFLLAKDGENGIIEVNLSEEGRTMNLRQLEYAVELSKVLSISQTAEKLRITQPALSKQILALEKDLGVVLFDRSVTPLALTPAGECFIRDAGEILLREKQLRTAMEDYKAGDRGRLTIGVSPFRASYFLSDIIKELQEIYPGLQVVLREYASAQLHKDAVEGRVDFSIMNLPVDESLLDVTLLEPEPVVLVVPKHLLNMLTPKNGTVTLADCKDLPFISLSKNQELRQLFERLCASEGFAPNVTTEVVGITTAWSLAQAGVGATVLPLWFIEEKERPGSVSIFSFGDSATIRQPAIVKRKGQPFSKYAKTAVELIVNR